MIKWIFASWSYEIRKLYVYICLYANCDMTIKIKCWKKKGKVNLMKGLMTKRPFRIHFEFCVHADMLFSVKTFSQQTCLWEHTCDDFEILRTLRKL